MEGPATKPDTQRHFQFVKKLAENIKRQINPPMEIDELVSCGFIGLQEAAGRYNPSTGVKFETFAYYRVKGAILEGISKQCHLSRHMAKKVKLTQKANDYMEGASGDIQGMSEKSRAASGAMLAGIFRDLTSIHSFVSTTIRFREDTGEREVEFVDESAASKHQEAVESSEIRQLLKHLTPEQSKLLKLYYFQDMSLEEAGRAIGITKSWACKLHNAAIKKLRQMVDELGIEPP